MTIPLRRPLQHGDFRQRNRPRSLNRIFSFTLGFLLVFSSPVGGGIFANWLIPLLGSYRMTIFDALALPLSFLVLVLYGFRITHNERFLYGSLGLVIVSRAVSLVVAGQMEAEQVVSVFRYIEGFAVIYVCNILFRDPINRARFIRGVLSAVVLETVGGIVLFAMSEGSTRGIFISVNSFMLQVFAIILGLVALTAGREKLFTICGILVVFLGLLATLTRSALLLLAVAGAFLFLMKHRAIGRPLLLVGLVGALSATVMQTGRLLPELTEAVTLRTGAAIAGQGGVLYRFYLWDMALGTFLEHPFFGIGSGGFARQQASAAHVFDVELTPEYQALDYNLGTHNNLLGVASETGLVGLIASLLFAIAVFRLSLSALRETTLTPPAVAATAIVTMALMLSDIWAVGSFTPISNTFIGFLAGWSREMKLSQS